MKTSFAVMVHPDLDSHVNHRFGIDPLIINRDLATGWTEPFLA
ncbi:hypothetical protein EDF46_3430 [Frondihabitans sp. PhB188]|nr:hypothetical protein [Frondihabitans sp. PhB188]ROQ30918.1 hypothetical protein EDF46_3430 [Frondihabitans sp. PhB188]